MAVSIGVKKLRDVQSEKDVRNVPLKYVGIDNLRWPLQLKDKKRGVQNTVAKVRLAVDLPQDLRGTHMSRFVECLQELEYLELGQEERVLDLLKEHLQARSAMMRLEFPYFIQKSAPVTGKVAPMDIDCVYTAEKGEQFSLKVRVEIPVQTLCPCSKEISDRGAHNQRAIARIEILASEMVWLEELAEMADRAASAPVYSLLKRPDEKFVTEHAYDNPRFVEDAVRELALLLDEDRRIKSYRVQVKSIESIHNHNAFAVVEKDWQ